MKSLFFLAIVAFVAYGIHELLMRVNPSYFQMHWLFCIVGGFSVVGFLRRR